MTGDYGEKPTIKIDAPLKVDETTSWTTEEGKGDKVGAEATTILALTLADGRTGKTAISTHDQGQRPLEIKLGDQVFPALAESLRGQVRRQPRRGRLHPRRRVRRRRAPPRSASRAATRS